MWVILINLSNEEFTVKTGNCIVQLIIEWCYTPKFVEVDDFSEEKTEIGQRGFGSSSV